MGASNSKSLPTLTRVQGPGFRVQGPGFRVQGPGPRVQGSGVREVADRGVGGKEASMRSHGRKCVRQRRKEGVYEAREGGEGEQR